MTAKGIDALALTRMWGATSTLSFTDTAPQEGVTLQLADIRIPEPVTASIYFEAQREGQAGTVQALTLDLLLGLGRTNVKRTTTFLFQPTFGAPILFALPLQPVVSVQAIVTARGFVSTGGNKVDVVCTIQVAPITRINYQSEGLKFGMALPGEADGMDDAMHEDLEEEAPGELDVMRAAQADGFDPGEQLDDEDEPPPRRIVVPPRYQQVIDRMTEQLGRAPKLRDLPPALQRRLRRALEQQMQRGRQ